VRPEAIAQEILASEDFMWLMVGTSETWTENHIDALRPTWRAYKEAGGKTYGKP
jgi:agmatine/peptidylarginine deiminase